MATWFIIATLALSWLTSSQTVEVQLKANWEKPPFQLSILETLATESEDHYLLALAEIASFAITDPFDEDEEIEPGVWSTDQELHENTLGSFSTRDKELLDIALASKYQSPRIISHYKHYTETVIPKHGDALLKKCGTITESWVQFNNVIYCKPDDIYALMTDSTSTQEAILPFDRVVGSSGPLLVFYANVNDSKFKQFASNLYDNARFAKTRFVMRYIPQFTDERETLSGYGASLNLKRYEDLVLPDQNSAGGVAEPADEIDQASPEEVKSFFGGYVDEVEPIENRNIRSLSAQAVSLLESFEDEELKFEMLKNLSFNFPSFVNFIGRRVEIDGSVSELYDKNQASGIRSESTGIFLNGCPLGEKADVFQLLEALKFQLNQVDQLKEYGFSAVSAKRIISSFGSRALRSLQSKRESKYKYYDLDSLIDLLEEVQHDVVEFSNFDMFDQASKYPTDMTTFSFFDNFGSEKAMSQALKALEFIKVSDVPIRVRLVHILDSSSFVSSLKPTSTSSDRSINVITDILQGGQFAGPGLLNSALQGFMDLLDIDSTSFLLADGRYVDLRNDILDVGVLQHFLDTEKRLRLDVMSEILEESSDIFSTLEPRDFGNWLESLKSFITSTFYSIEADSGVDYFPRFDLQRYFTGENDQDLDVLFIVDPILPLTQHLLPLVEVLKGLSFVNLVTVFAPEASIRKVDLQMFYRANVQTSVKFNSLGRVDDEVSFKFENVPQKTILRLNLETPRSWLTMVNQSLGDLENILISHSGNEKAVFELKNIIIDCDVGGSIPKNAVFEIGGGYDQSAISGSSYVQLKSNPGIWNVDLKSDESYGLGHIGEINIFNFNIKENYKLSVTKRRQQSELSKVMSTKNSKSQADINIFTFASGYSQEQMLTVMMASASNTTQSSVKFWILENFMSASLRAMLPTLAENYGFEYELISFKWPVWLKSAPDRQTEFWSYKFLFLDLLFDLDLDRVIYISPDQTILHDLKELVELDLEGSPYAFPWIGEGRVETDKYKFWDLGWWRDYLEGRYNFHSTSIFVVDLSEFRSSGAGDKLRNKFNDLTDDSSTMANLDLDFPNNSQDLVPIFTLSRLWGWCETWNAIVSASDAHSIDICVNPLVRERKIDSIKRLVPVWLQYYEEIEVLYNSVYPELSTFDVSEVVGTTNNENGHDEL